MDTLRDKLLLEELWDGRAPWKVWRLSRDAGAGHRPRRLHRHDRSCRCCSGAGHEVVGLDNCLFETCTFGDGARRPTRAATWTCATSRPRSSTGFDAVVHLAAISNDPLGDLNPETTYDINHLAASRLAARRQGGRRAAIPVLVVVQPLRRGRRRARSTRRAAFNPVTPYGESKVLAEQDLRAARRRRLQPDVPAQRDRVRRLAAAARRPRREQPRRLRGDHRRGADQERRHALAAARPHRGHQPRVPRRARGAARARARRGVQRRRDRRRTTGSARSPTIVEEVVPGQRACGTPRAAAPTCGTTASNCDKLPRRAAGVRAQVDGPTRRRGAVRRRYVAHGSDARGLRVGRGLHAHRGTSRSCSTGSGADSTTELQLAASPSVRERAGFVRSAVTCRSCGGRELELFLLARRHAAAPTRSSRRTSSTRRSRATRSTSPSAPTARSSRSSRTCRRASCSSTTTCTSRRSPTTCCGTRASTRCGLIERRSARPETASWSRSRRNDGYLLRNFVEAGIPVLGIDPAPDQAAAAEAAGVPTLARVLRRELAARLRAERPPRRRDHRQQRDGAHARPQRLRRRAARSCSPTTASSRSRTRTSAT